MLINKSIQLNKKFYNHYKKDILHLIGVKLYQRNYAFIQIFAFILKKHQFLSYDHSISQNPY